MANISTPTTTGNPNHDQILNLLQGEITPIKKTPLYSIGLFLVAVVMVLLPVVYIGLIGLTGFLTFLHATENVSILSSGSGGTKMRVLFYVAPLVAGIAVCLFMIKPLFARPAKRRDPLSLNITDEPLLFFWIDRLCHLVGAPRPNRIDVNCQVNASASFRRGIWSIFGNDLVLTIGLPLMAGMSLREFSGVLAHELGHFSQGSGLRLSYIIRSVNAWFARVVYERDAIDEAIEDAQESRSIWLNAIVGTARGCIWISRIILKGLMLFGHLISCFLLRQMEYDADRYEARVAGSKVFAETVRKLHEMSIGQQLAGQELSALFAEKRLPDDMPAFCLAKIHQADPLAVQNHISSALTEATSRMSTHPADRDRIASAENENTEGLLQTDLPATVLASDFKELSQRATREHFSMLIGNEVDPDMLTDTARLVGDLVKEGKRQLGVFGFTQGGLGDRAPYFPVLKPEPTETGIDDIRSALMQTRTDLTAADPEDFESRRDLIDRRLRLALHLAELDSDANNEALQLITVLEILPTVFNSADQLGDHCNQTMTAATAESKGGDDAHTQHFKDCANALHATYTDLRDQLTSVAYPFPHTDGDISCATYMTPDALELGQVEELVNASQDFFELLGPFYTRVISALVEVAEQAEAAIGLEPLSVPGSSDSDKEADQREAQA